MFAGLAILIACLGLLGTRPAFRHSGDGGDEIGKSLNRAIVFELCSQKDFEYSELGEKAPKYSINLVLMPNVCWREFSKVRGVNDNPLKLNILVVEDDKDLAAIMKMSLKRDHEVCVSHTLNEARHFLSSACIHLLLLDNNLPDGNGVDFIPEVRQQYPDAKIVMLSADLPHFVEKLAIAAGARGFIAKPFDLHVIDSMIMSLFASHC